MNQSNAVREEILKPVDRGFTDKGLIYNMVVENLNVPRPTVRRVCRDLIKDLEYKIKVLKNDELRPEPILA